MADKWLEREVARGLQGLVALRLAGAPAEDSVTLTLDIWLSAIDGGPWIWEEAADAPRIRSAFQTLYRICDRWPPPKVFFDHIPPRPPLMELPPPQISEAQRKRNLAEIRRLKEMFTKGKK